MEITLIKEKILSLCIINNEAIQLTMKHTKNISRKSYIMLLLLFVFSALLYGKNDLKSISDSLDYVMKNKEQYIRHKELEISSLQKLLDKKGNSLEYEYEINSKLSDEYKKFRLDSAILYAKRAIEIARVLKTPHLKSTSDINLARLYSYSGRFRESEEILKTFNPQELSPQILADYYEAYLRFFEHYSAISNQPRYSVQTERYRDSLLTVLDSTSFDYKVNLVHKYVVTKQIAEAETILHTLLQEEGMETPRTAVITYYLGAISEMRGEVEQEKKYHMLSAIADVKNAIKENASFQRLAIICYHAGDIEDAFKYSHFAIEDAIFSGVQFRTAQLSALYSIINTSYQEKERATNSKLKTYLILISLLSLFLILLVVYIYKQMHKVSVIKEKLSLTNDKLNALNNELNDKNDMLKNRYVQLSESNSVKEQYIAQFFDICSTYIDKMEEYRKMLYKLGINKQYEELMNKLKSTSIIDNELDELYSHFDKIFLNLYPTFVSDFNALLVDSEKIILKKDDMLNKELRIYALFRLGITDSVKIASFLRCSMSTIYNYRTKMRNKAAEKRDEFEELIMGIGNNSSTNHLQKNEDKKA